MPDMREAIQSLVQSWRQALADPQRAQEETLHTLLHGYARTRYGAEHGADKVSSIEEYRRAFPVVTYPQIRPLIEQVMSGDDQVLLYEPIVGWAMTRGTTGESKFIPMTETDLESRTRCGPRALMSYVVRTNRYDILAGGVLNLNFPSVIGTMTVGDRQVTYGYSSGIYARYNAQRSRLKLVPTQEEIDALGGGISKEDWENRFELAYRRAKDEKVTMIIGVTQVMLQFGHFLKKRFGVYPKVLGIELVIASSIAGIHTRYKPALRALYGPVDVVEMYGATEGMFGQQLDEKPYWIPNYDHFLFEVQTRHGVKMLHEMRRGEVGSLIVSTCLLPRYRIGDLILAFGDGYFRCIGRERPFAYLRYLWHSLWDWDFWR